MTFTSTSKYNQLMKSDNTISIIGRIREAANSIIVDELSKKGHKGLAPSHGDILATLIMKGEMTKTEIAEEIRRERSTVTTLIGKLEKLGYIYSKSNEVDGRSKIVCLTDKGLAMKNDMFEISNQIYNIQYQGMSEEEILIFRKGLMKVRDNFLGGK